MTLQELLHINEISFGENKAVVTPQFGLTVNKLQNIQIPENNFIYTGIADCCIVFTDDREEYHRFCFDYYCNIFDVLNWLSPDLSQIKLIQVCKVVRPGIFQDKTAFDSLILKNGNTYTQIDSAKLHQNANVFYKFDNTELRWYLVSYSQSKKMVL